MTTEERIQNLFGDKNPKNPRGLPTPSAEQRAIIETQLQIGESLKVEAKAGSGKTTCMLWLSHMKGSNCKILYICFSNKGAAEARERYRRAGIINTKACTVHALASETKALYEKAGKFQTKLTVKDIQKYHTCTHRRAWEILETIKKFCESERTIPTYEDAPQLPGVDNVVRNQIATEARGIWENMLDPEKPNPLSYDHYLKIYALTDPKLNYDYILLDEGQDSNPVTLSLLKNQTAHTRTVIIGDSNQAIYSWRGAKDAMSLWETNKTLTLTESFRFGKDIAAAANTILKTFSQDTPTVKGHKPQDSIGRIPRNLTHTLIARTNGTLFQEALDQIGRGKKFHFVGTREDNNWDPSGPYRFDDAKDVYRLYIGDRSGVRNPHLKAFESYSELKQAATGVLGSEGDKELESLCKIVEKHGRRLPELIAEIIKNCCGPEEADILLVSGHRSKGLEWNRVRMADDFAELVIRDPEGGVRLAKPSPNPSQGDFHTEEINLIYVAITRAMERLEINPRTLDLFQEKHLLPQDVTPPVETPGYSPQAESPKENPGKKATKLKIPFAKKDEAKKEAQSHGGALSWEGSSKLWIWKHPLGGNPPQSLEKYLIAKPKPPLAKEWI